MGKKKLFITVAIAALAIVGLTSLIIYFATRSGDKTDSTATTPLPSTSSSEGSTTSSNFDTTDTEQTTASNDQTTTSSNKIDLTSSASSELDSNTNSPTTSKYELDSTTSSATEFDLTTTQNEINSSTEAIDSTSTSESDEFELTSTTKFVLSSTEDIQITSQSPTTDKSDHTTDPDDEHKPENDNFLLKNSKKLNSWINNDKLSFETDFYFFNITNAEGIMKRKEKPILEQVGPYRFQEKRIYDVKGWSKDEEHLNLRYKKNYFPLTKSLDDKITVLNVPLITIYNLVDKWNFLNKFLAKEYLKTFDLFVTHRVGDLLFDGYEDTLIDRIKDYFSLTRKFGIDLKIPTSISSNGRFSFMASRNDSDYGLWSVNTGKTSLKRLGQLYTIDGKSTLDGCWTNQCALIRGSDGVIHSPESPKLSSIEIFAPELNRSIQLDNKEESVIDKIQTRKFVWSSDTLKSKTVLDTNECYYPARKDELDKYSGILRNSHCNHDIPMVFSYPHFYQSDSYFTDAVSGMSPNDKYESYIHLRKENGELMSALKNIQINIDTRVASASHSIKRFIFPLFWLAEKAKFNAS